MKIGIMLPNWIGDVVMATPTLRALRHHFGDEAELIGIMKPHVSQVLAGTTWLDDAEWYDRRGKQPELRAASLVRRLRARRLDAIVLLTNSLRAGVIGRLSGARERVGYARYGRRPLLTTALQPPREAGGRLKPISAIDYYLELAYAMGCPPQTRQMELATLPEDEAIVTETWSRLGLEQAEPVVVFNTGGAYGAAKHWPTENYVELAQRLLQQDPQLAILVICGPAERETAAWIAKQVADPRVVSMADEDLSLGVAKASVKRADLMVTTDSGPRHFAPAFDVPVVSLFGPIDARWSDSHHPQAVNLWHAVPCGPCGKRVCPLGHHQCMRGLTVDRVQAAVADLLARPARRRVA